MKPNIKEKVLKECNKNIRVSKGISLVVSGEEIKKNLDKILNNTIDLILAEVSKCSVCKKKKPIEFMSIECPDCYLKGMEKEGFISKAEVQKVIDDFDIKYLTGREYRQIIFQCKTELKQKLKIK